MAAKPPVCYLDSPLTQLGWNAQLEKDFAPHRAAGFVPARVATEDRHYYNIFTTDAELIAQITGKLLHESSPTQLPKTGDWVAVALHDGEEKATIHAVLPRQTQISRKVAGRNVEEQVLAVVQHMLPALGYDTRRDIQVWGAASRPWIRARIPRWSQPRPP